MNESEFTEICDDTWHILLHFVVLNFKMSGIQKHTDSVFELKSELVAINSLSENIVLRLGRLADKRKDVRSVKNFCKSLEPVKYADALTAFINFEESSEEIREIRNNRIGHMKVGELSSYPIDCLPRCTLSTISALVQFLDAVRGESVQFFLGENESTQTVDLRESGLKCEIVYKQ